MNPNKPQYSTLGMLMAIINGSPNVMLPFAERPNPLPSIRQHKIYRGAPMGGVNETARRARQIAAGTHIQVS